MEIDRIRNVYKVLLYTNIKLELFVINQFCTKVVLLQNNVLRSLPF